MGGQLNRASESKVLLETVWGRGGLANVGVGWGGKGETSPHQAELFPLDFQSRIKNNEAKVPPPSAHSLKGYHDQFTGHSVAVSRGPEELGQGRDVYPHMD